MKAPNAVLSGGPEPDGGRHVRAMPNAVYWRVAAADGSEHIWCRSDRLEPLKGRGWLRIYVHVGSVDRANALVPAPRTQPPASSARTDT